MGRYAERDNREQVYILTGRPPGRQRPQGGANAITSDLMESLDRLQTGYGRLPAAPGRPERAGGPRRGGPQRPPRRRRYPAFGGSNWTHERIAEANAYAKAKGLEPFRISSPYFGLCEQVANPWGPGCVSVSGAESEAARAFYQKEGIPVMAYSSLGRGMLSGRVDRTNYKDLLDRAALTAYAHEVNFLRLDRAREMAGDKGVTVPQLALAYILAQPFLVFPIVGAASAEELRQIAAAEDIRLSREECAWLENGGRR